MRGVRMPWDPIQIPLFFDQENSKPSIFWPRGQNFTYWDGVAPPSGTRRDDALLLPMTWPQAAKSLPKLRLGPKSPLKFPNPLLAAVVRCSEYPLTESLLCREASWPHKSTHVPNPNPRTKIPYDLRKNHLLCSLDHVVSATTPHLLHGSTSLKCKKDNYIFFRPYINWVS